MEIPIHSKGEEMSGFAQTSGFGVSYPIVNVTEDSVFPYGLVLASAVYVGIDDGDMISEINIPPTVTAMGDLFKNIVSSSLRQLATALTEKAEEIENALESGSSEASAFLAAFGPEEGKH